MAKALTISKPSDVEVWSMFANAVIEKPADFYKLFLILLKHASNELIELLATADANDVATTLLAALPASKQTLVTEHLNNNPDAVHKIRSEISNMQSKLRAEIDEQTAQGNHPPRMVS